MPYSAQKARQGTTSPNHAVARVLVISTALAIVGLAVAAIVG